MGGGVRVSGCMPCPGIEMQLDVGGGGRVVVVKMKMHGKGGKGMCADGLYYRLTHFYIILHV